MHFIKINTYYMLGICKTNLLWALNFQRADVWKLRRDRDLQACLQTIVHVFTHVFMVIPNS